MIIDFDEILQKKRKRKEPVPLTSDWTITGWDNFLSFSTSDQKTDGIENLISFTTSVTIIETSEFYALLDPRDDIIVGFPTEAECWNCASNLIGIESITVMKKLGWRVVNSTIVIQK